MSIENLRYNLTEHMKRVMFTYENFKLLIHPEFFTSDLVERLEDDLDLMPEIPSTIDDCEIKFYRYDYKENIYTKSELLVFILASINKEFDIYKGIDITTGKIHWFLKNGNLIYDPSLAVITSDNLYLKRFKILRVIKNEDVLNYIKENNNLYRFYH